jgi:hypothetical protein
MSLDNNLAEANCDIIRLINGHLTEGTDQQLLESLNELSQALLPLEKVHEYQAESNLSQINDHLPQIWSHLEDLSCSLSFIREEISQESSQNIVSKETKDLMDQYEELSLLSSRIAQVKQVFEGNQNT